MPKKSSKKSDVSFDSLPEEDDDETSIPGQIKTPGGKKSKKEGSSKSKKSPNSSKGGSSKSGKSDSYTEGTETASYTGGYTGTANGTGKSVTGKSGDYYSESGYSGSDDEGSDDGYSGSECTATTTKSSKRSGYTEEADEEEEEWTMEHLKLLYLISKYAVTAQTAEDKEGWIRETPLLVLIYEGVVAGALDYDYAPCSMMMGKRNVWMNVSQEGKDDLDDMRERGALNGLKLQSENFQAITAYQVSLKGIELIEELDHDARQDIENFLMGPPPFQTELLNAFWNAEEEEFELITQGGFKRPSTITETEDVSYVSSPWLPQLLRKRGRECTSNAHRSGESAEGSSTIADELTEVITLKYVNLLVGEWVPFGANQIVALNERLGAYDRCKGGMFSAQVDDDPTANTLATDVGLTQVEILDFEDTEYINFEAEINYPEDEGIIQVENFGMHISKLGNSIYGMRIEAILDRGADSISLDHLSRLLVDVHQDSSQILESLLSGYQVSLLDMIYMGYPMFRDKFNMIMAEDITPRCGAKEYCDREEKECELKQVIGQVLGAYDLGDEDFVIQGKVGVLVVGPNSKQFEAVLMCYLSLLSREMFIRAFFIRSHILSSALSTIRDMINEADSDPNSVQKIRELLSQTAREIIMMQGLLSTLADATNRLELPTATRGGAANAAVLEKLLDVFNLKDKQDDLKMRVVDLMKNVRGALNELNNLQMATEVINKRQLEDVFRTVSADTAVLVSVAAASERGSKSLEVMQVVLAASMAFDLVDRFTGFNQNIDFSVMGWQVAIAEYLIYPPMAWLAFNLFFVFWLCFGLLKLMKHLGEQSLGFLTIKITFNLPINLHRWDRYLSEKEFESQAVGQAGSMIKKVMWTEDDDLVKWRGAAPQIEAQWDITAGFLLAVSFTVDTKGHEWETENELRDIWTRDLDDFGIFELKGKSKPKEE